MKYEAYRRHLELSIMGGCILENKWKEVSFLTEKNFHVWGEWDLPFIWTLLPGDLTEIANKGRKHDRDIILHVCEITQFSVFDRIQPLAVLIMEDEYRHAFVKVLEKCLSKTDNATEKSAIIEVMTKSGNHNLDVYEAIDAGSDYIMLFKNDQINQLLTDFQKKIEVKNRDIKNIVDGGI